MERKLLPVRRLGNTGIKVTVLSFGNWVTGNKEEEV